MCPTGGSPEKVGWNKGGIIVEAVDVRVGMLVALTRGVMVDNPAASVCKWAKVAWLPDPSFS